MFATRYLLPAVSYYVNTFSLISVIDWIPNEVLKKEQPSIIELIKFLHKEDVVRSLLDIQEAFPGFSLEIHSSYEFFCGLQRAMNGAWHNNTELFAIPLVELM